MKTKLGLKCINNIEKEEIDIDSTEYLLEYLKGENQTTYRYIIPPLLIYENSKYKPVFGKLFIISQIEAYGRLNLSLVIFNFFDNYSLFKFLLFLKKKYLGLNTVEKSIFLNKFEELIGNSIYQELEIPKNIKSIDGYKKLYHASKNIKDDVVNGEINEINLFEIFYLFDEKYWELVENFIKKLKIGTKKGIELINILYDIIQRDNISLEELIGNSEIKRIMSSKLNPSQKGEKIFELFYERRYQKISRYKRIFNEHLKSLKLDKDILIELPQDFEKWNFRIHFNFNSFKDFKNKLSKLVLLSDNKDFEEVIKMRY